MATPFEQKLIQLGEGSPGHGSPPIVAPPPAIAPPPVVSVHPSTTAVPVIEGPSGSTQQAQFTGETGIIDDALKLYASTDSSGHVTYNLAQYLKDHPDGG